MRSLVLLITALALVACTSTSTRPLNSKDDEQRRQQEQQFQQQHRATLPQSF
jgi:outer membrane biogenesis lipoprotein LolB